MGTLKKVPSEGGSGGKRGHSSMEHWAYTDEIKKAAKLKRRQNDKKLIQAEMQEHELKRYWFNVRQGLGFGVTAFSEIEARKIASETADKLCLNFDVVSIIEDVDVRDLDQKHVIPNMGPPNIYGVWFPKLNI